MSQHFSVTRPAAHLQPNRVEYPNDLIIDHLYMRHFCAPLLENRGPSDPVATRQSEVVTMRGWGDNGRPMLEGPDGRVASYHLEDLGLAPYEGSGWNRFHYLVPLG